MSQSSLVEPVVVPLREKRNRFSGVLLEICRERRYRQAQQRALLQKSPLLMLFALLEGISLDEARKYRILPSAVTSVRKRLLDNQPPRPLQVGEPVWIEMKELQPLDAWSESEVAAFYFHPPLGAFRGKLPRALRSRSSSQPSFQHLWCLEIIDETGECLIEYQYNTHTGSWTIAPLHSCPWNSCIEEIGPGGERLVHACSGCLSDMEYLSRWFAHTLAFSREAEVHTSGSEEVVEVVREQLVPPRPWELWKRVWPNLCLKQSIIELRYTLVCDLS